MCVEDSEACVLESFQKLPKAVNPVGGADAEAGLINHLLNDLSGSTHMSPD